MSSHYSYIWATQSRMWQWLLYSGHIYLVFHFCSFQKILLPHVFPWIRYVSRRYNSNKITNTIPLLYLTQMNASNFSIPEYVIVLLFSPSSPVSWTVLDLSLINWGFPKRTMNSDIVTTYVTFSSNCCLMSNLVPRHYALLSLFYYCTYNIFMFAWR